MRPDGRARRSGSGPDLHLGIVAQLFAGNAEMPSQWKDRHGRPLTPAQRLCLAVLDEAFGTFRRYRASSEPQARKLAREAERWIASDDDSWPHAYRRCCEALYLDADWLRRGIDTWAARTPLVEPEPRHDVEAVRRMQAAVDALSAAGWALRRIGPAIGKSKMAAEYWRRGRWGVSTTDLARLEALVAQSSAA